MALPILTDSDTKIRYRQRPIRPQKDVCSRCKEDVDTERRPYVILRCPSEGSEIVLCWPCMRNEHGAVILGYLIGE